MGERSFQLPLPTRRSTIQLARTLAPLVVPHSGALWLLDGPLGAGKTFFVRALLRALGVPAREPVASPTFGLVHHWPTPRGLVLHADLYRLRAEGNDAISAVRALGLDDARREGATLLVEWGEGFEAALGGAADGRIAFVPAFPRPQTAEGSVRSAVLEGRFVPETFSDPAKIDEVFAALRRLQLASPREDAALSRSPR